MAQIHPNSLASSSARDEIDAAAVWAEGLDPTATTLPSPAGAINREDELLRLLRMARTGALMIIAFQFAYLEWDRAIWQTLPAGLMFWHVGNLLVGFVALSL